MPHVAEGHDGRALELDASALVVTPSEYECINSEEADGVLLLGATIEGNEAIAAVLETIAGEVICLDADLLDGIMLDAIAELDATGRLETSNADALDVELAAKIPAIWPSFPPIKDEGACLK